jgi:hypothetical protein
MKKSLPLLSLCLLLATPLAAQNWSLGVSTGPFVFGKFVERTTRTGTETTVIVTTTQLTAAPRPGLSVDIGNDFADRWGFRAEATFTESKLRIKNKTGSGVNLDAGKIDVTTFALPLVFHINPRGTFRFHIFGGPAYANYRIRRGNTSPTSSIQEFAGTRGKSGVVYGGGVDWWMSGRFAVAGNLEDITTGSPFERSDYPAGATGINIKRPHNVHTTVGVRYRF